jgi:hypothetical protein
MNILVRQSGSEFWLCRPDTTWEKDSEDFYAPDTITSLSYAPVLFTRICKAGKSIGKPFASRYFERFSYGVLLYPDDYIEKGTSGFCQACCIDHTSFLPASMYEKDILESGKGKFSLYKNGKSIFTYGNGTIDIIEKDISEVSALTYLRVGDIVASELAPLSELTVAAEEKTRISGDIDSESLLDFNIIMK